MDQHAIDKFLTIVIFSDDYEKIVSCNTALDKSSDANYCVIAALSAQQGLSLSQAHQPDCLIIDTSLASSELFKTLSERHTGTPIVLLIEASSSNQAEEAKNFGFHHSIENNNIDNDGLPHIVQAAIKDTLSDTHITDDKYRNQRKLSQCNAYSYAEPKDLTKNTAASKLAQEKKNSTIDLANILMVEDNIHDIKLAEILLREDDKLQFNMFTASNGEEALEFLCNSARPRIDLILLDINMPIMNGFEFLEQRQKDLSTSHIPVIVCSTSSYKPDQARANELGAEGYIIKPPSLEKIRIPLSKVSHIKIKHQGNKRALQYIA
ncbi:MAG: response regulator [Gammaproteobacteria bacterium]|nr:response regulator [Gammaproteobacteria bacterium]